MTDETTIFYRRFVDDVRRCTGGRAPAEVAEIERRVRVALVAPPSLRERRWARVVAAVNELLAGLGGEAARAAHAGRLRAFVRENADLGRPRDLAITDFRFVQQRRERADRRARAAATWSTPRSRARRRDRGAAGLDEIVAGPTRLLAEWAVYALCGGARGRRALVRLHRSGVANGNSPVGRAVGEAMQRA